MKLEEMIGKTVDKVGKEDSSLLIVFKDKTFIWLEAKNGWDGCHASFRIQDNDKVLEDLQALARELEIVTVEQVREYNEACRKKDEEIQTRSRRALYEKLKTEFELAQSPADSEKPISG